MKKEKLFAPFLMLFAGAVSSIAMYLFRYSMEEMLPVLLAVLIIFYIAGCMIQKNVVSFMDQISERSGGDGGDGRGSCKGRDFRGRERGQGRGRGINL